MTRTLLIASVVSACLSWGPTVAAQERKSSGKKATPSAPAGTRAPTLKAPTPAHVFSQGFEQYKQGNFEDAEELFLAGLKLDDKDHRAWEWLARSQAALNKDDEAERSLQQAVTRGLTKEREETARNEMFLVLPTKIPAHPCITSQVRQILLSVRVPRNRYAIEAKRIFVPTLVEYQPIAPGIFEGREEFATGTFHKRTGLLANFLFCSEHDHVTSLHVGGTIFPLSTGNKFTVKFATQARYGGYATHKEYACVVEGPRSDLIPTNPPQGTLTSVMCENTWNVDTLPSQTTKAQFVYSSLVGAFLPYSGGAAFTGYNLKVTPIAR